MTDRTYEIDTDESFFELIEPDRKDCLALAERAKKEGHRRIYFGRQLPNCSYEQFPERTGNLMQGVRTKSFIISTSRKLFQSIVIGDVFHLNLRYS